MAKPGTASRLTGRGAERADGTRRALVEAAIETLKADGFARRQRPGHRRAGRAATRASSSTTSGRWSTCCWRPSTRSAPTAPRRATASRSAGVDSLDRPRRGGRGHLPGGPRRRPRHVLVEMIAGASSTPGLGPEVAERIAPWTNFARQAIEASLGLVAPRRGRSRSADIAHAVVALYLGLEMLSHLDGDRSPALALFDRAGQLAALVAAFAGPAGPTGPAAAS